MPKNSNVRYNLLRLDYQYICIYKEVHVPVASSTILLLKSSSLNSVVLFPGSSRTDGTLVRILSLGEESHVTLSILSDESPDMFDGSRLRTLFHTLFGTLEEEEVPHS